MKNETNMLVIKDFKCGYDTTFNIQNINIKIPKSCFAGVIGPNGSGKTTLFRGIMGELKTKQGSVMVNDQDVSQLKYKQKAKQIAVVNQQIETIHLSVEDYVLLGRIPYQKQFNFFESKEDFAVVEKYMQMTDVSRFKDKMMSELSGGEQQLSAIARALSQQPSLLLLDEPTAHLDITRQVQVLNMIQRLNQNLGLTVLMNIHDLNLASEYCDYLIMLNEGEVFIQGTPEEVITFKNIEEVYKTPVLTEKNPLSKKPMVYLVSERVMNETKNK